MMLNICACQYAWFLLLWKVFSGSRWLPNPDSRMQQDKPHFWVSCDIWCNRHHVQPITIDRVKGSSIHNEPIINDSFVGNGLFTMHITNDTYGPSRRFHMVTLVTSFQQRPPLLLVIHCAIGNLFDGLLVTQPWQ